MLNLKLSLDHLAHLDLQDLPGIKEMPELQEPLVILEDLDLKALLANLAHLAIPEKKELQATTELPEPLENQATTEKRELLATMAHLVYLEVPDYLAKTVTMELLVLSDLRVKLAHQVTQANSELLVIQVAQDQLDPSDPLALKENLAPLDI